MSEPPQRRSSDHIDPDVRIAITEGDADNRHILRNEFTEAVIVLRADLAGVRQDVQVGNLAQVTEFAQIKAKQDELADDVSELREEQRAFEPRLRRVEDASVRAVATGDLRKTLWRAAGVVCSVLIGTAAVLVAVLN